MHLGSQTIEFLYSFKLSPIVISGSLKVHLHLEELLVYSILVFAMPSPLNKSA